MAKPVEIQIVESVPVEFEPGWPWRGYEPFLGLPDLNEEEFTHLRVKKAQKLIERHSLRIGNQKAFWKKFLEAAQLHFQHRKIRKLVRDRSAFGRHRHAEAKGKGEMKHKAIGEIFQSIHDGERSFGRACGSHQVSYKTLD